MTVTADQLYATLESLQERADRDRRSIVVVGGAAAFLHVHDNEVALEWPPSIAAIAAIRRFTNDVDCVDASRDNLERELGAIPIDWIPGRSIDDHAVPVASRFRAMSERHTVMIPVGRTQVRVVAPSLFVIHKASAYGNRFEARDLADIAATAVRAAANLGGTPELLADEIAELLPRIPGADRELRRVAARYATNDADGVTAFLNVVRAAISVRASLFEDAEDELRDMIGSSARRLLARWSE